MPPVPLCWIRLWVRLVFCIGDGLGQLLAIPDVAFNLRICLSDYFLYSQNLRVLKYVGDEKKAEWGRHWIEQGFNGTGRMVGLFWVWGKGGREG